VNKINYEERAKVYTDALETFGVNVQLVVALEELSECQKEVCKALRGGANIYHLAEEVADAIIMLEQVRQIFGINEEVCKAMDGKVLRLRRRVEAAKISQRPDLAALRDAIVGPDVIREIVGKGPLPYSDDEKTESGLLEEG
jgi:hypothetical protein